MPVELLRQSSAASGCATAAVVLAGPLCLPAVRWHAVWFAGATL